MLYYKKYVFKASGRLLLVFSKLNKKRGATFLIEKICVEKKWGLFFSLLDYFYNTKNACLKKAGAPFQFIKLNLFSYFCNSETCVFKSNGKRLFSLFG